MSGRSEQIRSALACIPSGDRDIWLRMGMALKSELGDAGYEIWDDWSQSSASYDASDAKRVWKSLNADGGVTIGSLFHEARNHGWREDGRHSSEVLGDQVLRPGPAVKPLRGERERTKASAIALLRQAAASRGDHPYLQRKGIQPVERLREIECATVDSVLGYRPKSGGEPLNGRILLAQIETPQGLSSVEMIDEDGRKTALPGKGTKTGGYWSACDLPEGAGDGCKILIGEGVATVMSAQAATGHVAVAALAAGNLPNVAKVLHEQYPKAEIVILADLGKSDGEPVLKAREAACVAKAKLAIPDFGSDKSAAATDFNDLARMHGPKAVLKSIAAAERCDATTEPSDAGGFQQDRFSNPDMSLLRPERGEPPQFPIFDVFVRKWVDWILAAAEAKGAPIDYVAAALLSVVSSLLGNSRWPAPWQGWAEPPILWAMIIGPPSANKSPALDAVVSPLRTVQQGLAAKDKLEHEAWATRAEAATIALTAWKEQYKKEIKNGGDPPDKPTQADPGPEPHIVRLFVNDVTIERLAELVSLQPRGILFMRDELAGMLGNMTRYSNGGTDQPAWLEAYGGRPYRTERMGRESFVEHFSVAVLGGIQPDKLASLLFGTDDDGMLARFMPIWPDPAPIKRPDCAPDADFAVNAFKRLHEIEMVLDEDGRPHPWFVPFNEEASELLLEFKRSAREQENREHGLLVSFIGKCPGFAVRLALVLAHLEWAVRDSSAPPPAEITAVHFGRACHFVSEYLLPMARRAYAEAAVPAEERAARSLARLIHGERIEGFSIRDVTRRQRQGLTRKAEVEPALDVLMQSGWIHKEDRPSGPKGGRPGIVYRVNPGIWRLP